MDETLNKIGVEQFGIEINKKFNEWNGINEESDSTSLAINM